MPPISEMQAVLDDVHYLTSTQAEIWVQKGVRDSGAGTLSCPLGLIDQLTV